MFVFSNLAISVDGKIGTRERGHFSLGTAADRRQMHVLRRRADAILMGADSLRAFRKFCRADGKKGPQPLNAVLSTAFKGVSPDWSFFSDPSLRRVLFHTSSLPAARTRRFADTSEIVLLKAGGGVSLAQQMIRDLSERGVRKLLVEGGGGLMWEFAKENLIDEYHVTITPWIVGGSDAPTLVDGSGLPLGSFLGLRLFRVRRVGDELFLVYQRKR